MKALDVHMEIMSDEAVIENVVSGNQAIFEILIRRYNAVLYKIGRMYGFSHHDTEDLMQDTHVAAFTQLNRFESRSTYKTWLSRIMINKCIYKSRYGYFKKEVPSEILPESNNENMQTEHNMLNRELSVVLEKCLDKIPVIYRTVFVLREIEGFSIAETAELMNITPVNVKVRLNRAKALLQKQLEQFYSSNDIYSFHLMYCDNIVRRTLEAISKLPA